jgi:hypothetical protein
MSDPTSVSEVAEKTELPITENKDIEAVSGESTNQNPSDEASQYITGVGLYAVIGGLTMVAFLMMLDSTIITTVMWPILLLCPS